MRIHRSLVLIVVVFLIISCIVSQESPAPGCTEVRGCVPVMGGCSGKTIIADLVVENGAECLRVETNNCNGGVLVVQNSCSQVFYLGNEALQPGDRVVFDFIQAGDGEIKPVHAGGNFSNFIPENDTAVELSAKLGSQDVRITFTKTKPLCK